MGNLMGAYSLLSWKLILFDLDGTIIDSEEAIIQALELTISSYPQSHQSSTLLKNLIGQPLLQIIATYLNPDHVLIAAQMYRRVFMNDLKSKVFLYKGIENIMKKLEENKTKMIVVTNRDTKTASAILQELGIESYFIGVFGSDLGIPKPSDDLINKAIKFARVNKKNTLFIGDTRIDYEAAQKAGVSFMLFDPAKIIGKTLPISTKTVNNWCELTAIL